MKHPGIWGPARAGVAVGAAAIVFAASCGLTVFANPTGGQVVSGTVSIQSPGAGRMNINQSSANAIVNWNAFSIGANESVTIAQPSASSALLNRVVGNDASVIAGRLSANGKVFLVNPAGVIFAPGSSANVGSLIASTLNVSDADFRAGSYRFVGTSAAPVRNAGTLTAGDGGTVALLGATVSNRGNVSARLGTVALGAGKDITLDFAGDGLTTLKINQGAARALVGNTGLLAADAGMVVMSAQTADALAGTVINQQGIVRAQSLTERNGRIILDGGRLGVTQSAGTLDATGGAGLTGGRIDVTGYDVALLDNARADASGAAGGGAVRLGGGAAGADPSIRNANAVWMAPGASLRADALQRGDGGSVIAFAGSASRLHGTLSARGGPNGGDGGTIETSGHYLDTTGAKIDASAPRGRAGTWVLDPATIDIVGASGASGASSVPATETPGNNGNPAVFTPAGPISEIVNTLIQDQLNTGTSVTVTTVPGNYAGPGDINVLAPIAKTAGGDAVLTLSAAGSISVTQNIVSTAGRLGLVFDANVGNAASGNIIRTSGSAAQTEGGIVTTPLLLTTNGGDVSIGVRAGQPGSFDGAAAQLAVTDIDTRIGGSATAASGSVTIHGQASGATAFPGIPTVEVPLAGIADVYSAGLFGSNITTSTGAIEVAGNLGSGTPHAAGGVLLISSLLPTAGALPDAQFRSSLTTGSGAIRLFGIGTNAGNDANFTVTGVRSTLGSAITSATGPIDIRGGLAGGRAGVDFGTSLDASAVSAAGAGGTISVAGSTNIASAGVVLSTVTNSVPNATSTLSVGPAGQIVLRAANNGSSNSLNVAGTPVTRSGAGGTLVLLPGGVDTQTFGITAAAATPINLNSDAAGFSVTPAALATLAGANSGFANVIAGGTTQTGRITVNASGAAQPAFGANLTLASAGGGSQGIALPDGILLPGGTLTLSSAGAVTQGGPIRAASLLLAGPGVFTLNDPRNAVGTLSMANAGTVGFLNSAGFAIGPVSGSSYDAALGRVPAIGGGDSTLSGNLIAQAASGNMALQGGLTTGGSVDLTAEQGVFSAGASGSLSAANGWRVWASTWNGEARGNVQPDTPQPNFYGCSFGAGCGWGGAVPASGNHYVYVERPRATVTADGATRVFGAPNPRFTVTVSGLVNGDSAAQALGGQVQSTATAASPPGQYPIVPSFISGVGYLVDNVPGVLTVTAPPVTPPVTPTPVEQSGVQTFFSSREQTFVYENNLQGTGICIGASQPLFTTAAPGDNQDILAIEWKRVRTQPNLNSCLITTTQHGCGDF